MSQDSATQTKNNDENPEDLYAALNSVSGQLETIQKFVARRFDEISMEVNATAQQMDMAEDGTAQKFSEIFEVLQAISFSDGGATPANTGVELDAVVETTEKAANTILDAAERMSETISAADWDNEETRTVAVGALQSDIQNIIMACSFQDVTGQRINKTLENIRSIEDRLGGALANMGIAVEKPAPTQKRQEMVKGASQDDIDSLFDD